MFNFKSFTGKLFKDFVNSALFTLERIKINTGKRFERKMAFI